MGTKKKAVKKSKTKSKKPPTATKHVDRTSRQDAPEVGAPEDETQPADIETQDEDDDNNDENDVLPPVKTEKVDDEPASAEPDESGDDQKVPEFPAAEEKPKYASVCHQRIERLKQSESGGRGSPVRRKLSLQHAVEAARQETRRMSLADMRQVKHPLRDTWTFWYFMGNRCKQWSENLRLVCKVDTVEDFWCLYNDLISPSQLTPGKDFSLFKKHIRPEWEDVANKSGGMWSFCPREKNQKSLDMDLAWLEILMFLIGDQFDNLSHCVNGVSYSKRKAQDRISLWIGSDLARTDEILDIGRFMKQAIGRVTQSFKLEYSTSDDWKQKTGSTVTVRHLL